MSEKMNRRDAETQSKSPHQMYWVHRAKAAEKKLAELPDSPTWPYVLAFAKRMEAKLAQNRHKGNREGWINDHPVGLWERINDERLELHEAMWGTDAEQVWSEAADVANFAMMVGDSFAVRQQSLK